MNYTAATPLTFEGVTQPISEWALDYGVTPQTIIDRLHGNWLVKFAITSPMTVPKGYRLPGYDAGPVSAAHSLHASSAIECFGKTQSLAQWAAEIGTTVQVLKGRITRGMGLPMALQCKQRPRRTYEHDGRSLTLKQWSVETGISETALKQRMDSMGWSVAKALTTPHRRRGVPLDLPALAGTGGGRSAQERPEISFQLEKQAKT
jgi:hypothetical protein